MGLPEVTEKSGRTPGQVPFIFLRDLCHLAGTLSTRPFPPSTGPCPALLLRGKALRSRGAGRGIKARQSHKVFSQGRAAHRPGALEWIEEITGSPPQP